MKDWLPSIETLLPASVDLFQALLQLEAHSPQRTHGRDHEEQPEAGQNQEPIAERDTHGSP